ncbi:sigma factor G inhibitor Gin [Bacillus velezensis]|uniref:sigma factor G inhibitor Gin n=1 Tax=Bacillus velezensis TaxID=492670 RepID=UPI00203B11C9|nr:sigma factor G inhibitor Gin [Bacillus velezensis]MCM3108765.1 sigma factor G inhibitor Gin [Bacillus velezensis]MDQ9149923.1 sigma factor G inhibitor Gin [Bacillus velezensis]MEC0384668.1 sigma factor G inhibitor Gin [Bacillus velezensis]MEC0389804.1 sigma factor G inhibitor Gin [Bacillus velezensis]MEC2185028.1 sigma factor G inhibitor Gin [Bacillus velezensis]
MNETSSHEETCIVCETKKSRGIHIYTKFICLECEKKVVSTPISDPNYEFFVRKLKSLHTPTLYS